MTLTQYEKEYIQGILKRDMNLLEEGMLDVMFSEHCSYKSSRPILSLFPSEGENIILGPGDDAGLVSINDKYALAVGMESHNHPSAIEPYGGAGTGVGGILRDIISMGAMPIAILDSIRFGPLEDEKSRYLFEHVVKGISDYGNRVGIPTVGGELEFDESFKANPLVNVMCAGLVEKDKILRAIAPNVGDVFFLMGGTTGRDGIHGVTFASEELTEDSEEDRPAVQVADPFTKKKVLEASLEIFENINVSGCKDLGGGGLTCCISELADSSENGAIIYLNEIPLREEKMTPYEIMLSESQERMVFVLNKEDVKKAHAICEKHEISSSVIGEVKSGNNMIVLDDNTEIANLPTILLADPPSINRPMTPIKLKDKEINLKDPELKDSLLKMISSPNLSSKKWVYKQYDYEVQIRTAVKPGDDAAILKIDDEIAIALSADSNTIHTKLSPYDGGAGSVAESIRNVISCGAKPYAVVDCLNFGNPENPEILWQFQECIKGMSEVARSFNSPVISGNVSFYNETEGIKINPTPACGVIGVLELENIRTMEFKNENDKIVLIGKTYDEINGSEYHRTIHNLEEGLPPKIRVESEVSNGLALLNLISSDDKKAITAVHDCSAGGIAITLAEMALSSDLGFEIDSSKIITEGEMSLNNLLYSETHGRYILTVKSEELENVLNELDVPSSCIGEVKGNSFKVDSKEIIVISDLKNKYNNALEKYMP
ncbi:MAG: phosphoribosylformylglycinamidine synthase subunit PurL [Methanobacteriaceae archaeon]|jgi:phosphoribosylformylglycinamidine synthase|nr:phosphoribosylformylglycinamidine synthase subunit PurL [Methanobacteriaceae archaeon]